MIKKIVIFCGLIGLGQINTAKPMQSWLRPLAVSAVSFVAGVVSNKKVPKLFQVNLLKRIWKKKTTSETPNRTPISTNSSKKTNGIVTTLSSFANQVHNVIAQHPVTSIGILGIGSVVSAGIYCYNTAKKLSRNKAKSDRSSKKQQVTVNALQKNIAKQKSRIKHLKEYNDALQKRVGTQESEINALTEYNDELFETRETQHKAIMALNGYIDVITKVQKTHKNNKTV